MTTSMAEQQLAARLRDAYESGPIAPFAQRLHLDLAAAYRIQEQNTEFALMQQNRCLVGRKIGLTSPAVQKQLGVDQPDYGILFSDMQIPDGADAPLLGLIQPKIEAEIAFGFRADVDDPEIDIQALVASIEWAAPALEIVDSRIEGWKIGIVETIADNASSGRFVVGQKTRMTQALDVIDCAMVLSEDGVNVSTGSGAACLGSPLFATRWLARKMIEVGRPIRAGEVVLSGALGPMVTVCPGRTYQGSIDHLGDVSVSFDLGLAGKHETSRA